MRTFDEKRKWELLALAGGVLVFAGFQFYWFLAVDGSTLQAMSIMTSILLTVMLLKLSKTRYKGEIKDYLQNNNQMEDCDFYEELPLNSKVHFNKDVADHLANIKDELGQAEQLVNEAVTNLVINFKYISELTRSQRDMVLSVEKLAVNADHTEVVKLLRRQMMMMKKIEEELATTVTSMQFGDLVAQLLKHTTRQINTLDTILQHMGQNNIQGESIHQSNEKSNRISSTTVGKRTNNQTNPVVQQGMQSGEIELF